MTVDLYGPRWAGPRLGLAAVVHILSPTAGSLHIDAGKPARAQQYNRFDALFQGFKPLSDICNFTFDTLKSRPYKRVSHGERGVPKRRA